MAGIFNLLTRKPAPYNADESWLDAVGLGGLSRATQPGGDDNGQSFRGAILPMSTQTRGTYPGGASYEDPNFAWPGMITEPVHALRNLVGSPENPGTFWEGPNAGHNSEDMNTLIMSMFGGNTVKAGKAAVAAGGVDRGTVGMFGGRQAARNLEKQGILGPKNALTRAEEMKAASGADKNAIWNETGWFQGPDQKWRFEIDDSGAKRGAQTKTFDRNPGFAGGLMDHEEFFKAYPQAKEDLATRMGPIEAKRSYGSINTTVRPDGRMYMKHNPQLADEDYLSNQLHEFQHGVQVREGFSPGTNPRSAGSVENYLKTAGEVEARTTQKRMTMTAGERRARAPWLDYDVPESDQIVRLLSDTKPSILGSAPATAGQPFPEFDPELEEILRRNRF
jgi:Large polyvalent protein associated domain 23